MTPRDLLLSHLSHIRKVAKHAAKRHMLSTQDTEDFVSDLQEKLLEEDCKVIRMHKGKSTFKTYLNTVIQNFLRDYKNRLWGKYRPPAEAKRLGLLAVKLDELLYREHYTLDEAYEVLKTNYRVEKSQREIRDLAARLPARAPRKMDGEEALAGISSPGPSPEQKLLDRERAARLRKALDALHELLATLPAEDQLILQMLGEFQVSEIARVLDLKQKPLYPRIDKLKKQLKEELQRRGVDPKDLDGVLPPEEER